MEATTENIPAGQNATFTVQHIPDDSSLATESSTTAATSVDGEWVSKKPSADWNGAEVKFKVAASGAEANSEPDQLSFHRYPDIPQASISGRMQSPPAPATANYGWDKKVYIEFTDRELILTVKVQLINRTESRPERGKKESYGDYWRRCQATATGGPVPDAAKQDMKRAIEAVYRDEQYLHRADCERGDACDCDLGNKCCKFKVKAVVEFVESAGAMVQQVNLWPSSGRASSNDWYRIESRPGKSWPHEVGHLMGFYDEYSSGAVGNPPWQHDAPTSIMGSGTEVFDYHLEEFRAWFAAQAGEEFGLREP